MLWIAAAVLLVLVATVLRLGLLAYALYAVAGAILVSRYLAQHWAAGVTARRTGSRWQLDAGETITVTLEIENRSPLPIPWLLIEDQLPRSALAFDPPRIRVEGSRLHLIAASASSSQSLQYQLRCNVRGYYQIGPLVLETGDLFGLHRRFRVLTEPDYLLVLPKVIPLAGYDVASRRPIGEVRMTYRLFEDPTRISGVRAYEPGDPLSRVHWRATARTGALHSKVYEPSTVAGATILLDFHAAAFDSRHEPARSELAITAAASIADAVYLMGQQVGLVTNGRDAADRIRTEGWATDWRTRAAAKAAVGMAETSDRLRPVIVETRRGPAQLQAILEALARLEITGGLTLPQLTLEAAGRLPRDATLIAILTKSTPEAAIALANLRRRGLAVVALLNIWDDYDFAVASGPFLAQGIETRHLKSEASLPDLCRRQALAS